MESAITTMVFRKGGNEEGGGSLRPKGNHSGRKNALAVLAENGFALVPWKNLVFLTGLPKGLSSAEVKRRAVSAGIGERNAIALGRLYAIRDDCVFEKYLSACRSS